MHRSIHLSLRDIPENHKRAEERVDMGYENWDAALVIRANELLTEVRRYHADAEATRLQLSSSAASIARKVDELPVLVRQVVETCFEQDASSAERATVAKRLDLQPENFAIVAERDFDGLRMSTSVACGLMTLRTGFPPEWLF